MIAGDLPLQIISYKKLSKVLDLSDFLWTVSMS